MPVTIESIADYPHLVPTIAHWHWHEWGYCDPAGSLESWTVGLQERTFKDEIPTTYIALDDHLPVGSVTLVAHDMDTYTDLSPWLAGLYVIPTYRRRGIGSMLVQNAIQTTAKLGIPKLYLYTHTADSLYRRLGWQAIGNEYYEGQFVTMMVFHTHSAIQQFTN